MRATRRKGGRWSCSTHETATQLFGDPGRAIGQRLRLDQATWRDVIGVVGNGRTTFFNTLEWRTDPIVYTPAAQSLSNLRNPEATHVTLWIHIRADRSLSAAEVRDTVSAVDPRAVALSLQPVPDAVAMATRQPTFRMTLLVWFCGASLLLAAIGVYSIVTQAVTERVREIAIRLAPGAHPRELTMSFVRNALTAGIAGLVIGVALSFLLARTPESMLYGVRTGDAISLTAAGLLLLVATRCAAWLPALRATRVSAIRVLRA